MRRRLRSFIVGLALVASQCAHPAAGEVSVRGGKFWFNGERKDVVVGRSSFKLANIVTYHYTGQGGGKYNLGFARRWVEHNQRIFGKDVVLRVFLETAGWQPCEDNDCMFGSEPRDQGFWQRARLRDGARETEVHPVGRKVVEWFFAESERSGVAFELVIDATLKHDNIPAGEIDHVIRQVGVLMGELAVKYPRALIIPNLRNEYNAHNQSGHTLADVNMWAVRWDRDEYWIDAPFIVDPGGGNVFEYEVGPEPGRYNAGMVHPDRGEGWERFPNPSQIQRLKDDARGMPVGFTESMYYVEAIDRPRAERWYRRGGWTTNLQQYKSFVKHALQQVDYFIIHDEKGAQSDPDWPRPMTRLEEWLAEEFSGTPPPPPPSTTTTTIPPTTTTTVPPDPEPGPGFDLEKLLGLLRLLGIDLDLTGVGEFIQRTTLELDARGKQLDRLEANQVQILAELEELRVSPPPTTTTTVPPTSTTTTVPPEPEYMPAWDELANEQFGRAPHRTATWRKALMSIDQQLIWDGIRHPAAVLSWGDFEWPYRGAGQPVDQARARDILTRATDLLARLRHFVEFDPRDNTAVATGGTWLDGRVRRENFEQWHSEFKELWPWLESINGISARQ